jgi:diguanylate cyclase (GGDEF)-like protein
MLSDAVFRRSVLAFRWFLLAIYAGLGTTGVLDVTDLALFISVAVIGAYDIWHTALEVIVSRHHKFNDTLIVVNRYLDIAMITVALVALHDVKNPVWAIYFISIVGVAHFITKREMFVHIQWVTLNYLAFALITQLAYGGVSWPYVAIVAIAIQLMGINAQILAGGEVRLRQVMRQAAITDSLTGLPNRHHFHEQYNHSLAEAARERQPLAVMLIDVDHFKEINDTHGHPAGDDKLRDVATNLRSAMRGNDMVARYGGDEFIAIAHGASRGEAVSLAERLRDAAAFGGASVSIGVAICPEDGDTELGLIEAADAALYRAKEAGRNCVRTLPAA